MNKLDWMGKWVVVAGGLVVIVALVAVYGWGGGAGVGSNNNVPQYATSTATGTPDVVSSTQAAPATGSQGIQEKAVPAGSPVIFSTPVPGETWKIGAQNLVSWSPESGVWGQIELLDATTKDLVGVILNQVAPHQTSYMWNTRDLLLNRTSPQKKTVLPGKYVVRILFDGNNLSPITSQPITLEQ